MSDSSFDAYVCHRRPAGVHALCAACCLTFVAVYSSFLPKKLLRPLFSSNGSFFILFSLFSDMEVDDLSSQVLNRRIGPMEETCLHLAVKVSLPICHL